MKFVKKQVQSIPYVINYLTSSLEKETYSFEILNEAPWYVRLLSLGRYCAYKKTIYVPIFHLQLVKSEHQDDRNLATAQILPWLMLLHDHESVSLFKLMQSLYSLKYQLHYFLYTFLFLKAIESRFYEMITTGFIVSRRKGLKRVSPQLIETYLTSILDTNSAVLTARE